MANPSRREAIGWTAGAVAAAAWLPACTTKEAAPAIGGFATAVEMLAALRAKRISSVELYDLHVDRIRRYNPALNAIIIETFERGRAEPAQADRRIAAGKAGALTGLPMTLLFHPQVAIHCGLPATAFPAGVDGEGLPIGLQAGDPRLEDRTPLRFAQLLEREGSGFVAPPGLK